MYCILILYNTMPCFIGRGLWFFLYHPTIIFFAKEMIAFLNANEFGLCGLSIMFSNAKLKEVELADDLDNLKKVEFDLPHFVRLLVRLLARINRWHFGLGMRTLHSGKHILNFNGFHEVHPFII